MFVSRETIIDCANTADNHYIEKSNPLITGR